LINQNPKRFFYYPDSILFLISMKKPESEHHFSGFILLNTGLT